MLNSYFGRMEGMSTVNGKEILAVDKISMLERNTEMYAKENDVKTLAWNNKFWNPVIINDSVTLNSIAVVYGGARNIISFLNNYKGDLSYEIHKSLPKNDITNKIYLRSP